MKQSITGIGKNAFLSHSVNGGDDVSLAES